MLDEAGWQDLVHRLARETNPKARIMLLAQMEKAARDEQEHLKAQLQDRIEEYTLVFGPIFKGYKLSRKNS